MSEQEKWLPVVGWEGLYEVSDFGRVRSLDRTTAGGSRAVKGRMLKLHKDQDGYLLTKLANGVALTRRVHLLVLKSATLHR